MRDHTQTMLRSASLEAVFFAVFIFGIAVIVPELLADEPAPFSWPRIAMGIAFGAVFWFGMAMWFSRPTSWQIPTADRDWIDQQIGYLKLPSNAKRTLEPDGQAYRVPQAFHSGAELWIRPAGTAGQLRIDGPRQLIKKLRKRYAKRAATSS